ncbi:MAG: hypothetical protein ACYDHM_02350 [Acidiferrobacterales bacterium]
MSGICGLLFPRSVHRVQLVGEDVGADVRVALLLTLEVARSQERLSRGSASAVPSTP